MKQIRFIDREKQLCKIEIEYGDVLSICGDAGTYYGQVLHEIKPATKAQEDLLHFWELYHLKANYPAEELESIINELENEWRNHHLMGLDKYGDIDIYDKINLDDQIEKITTILAKKHPNKYITFDDGQRVVALLRATEYDCIDLDYLNIIDDDLIEIYKIPYCVCEEERVKDICREFIDRYMWVDAVTAGNTDLGYYEWQEEVMGMDGYGLINSYDGKAYCESINGVEYYVIRQQ